MAALRRRILEVCLGSGYPWMKGISRDHYEIVVTPLWNLPCVDAGDAIEACTCGEEYAWNGLFRISSAKMICVEKMPWTSTPPL